MHLHVDDIFDVGEEFEIREAVVQIDLMIFHDNAKSEKQLKNIRKVIGKFGITWKVGWGMKVIST